MEIVAGERKEGAGGSWSGLHLGVSLGEVGRPVVLVTGRVGCLPSSPPPGIAAGKSGRNRVGHNQINQSINQVAFAMLENEYFRELLACLNQSIANLLPRARATLRGWIMDEYVAQKMALKDELAQAISDIHLSFDLWKSPNYIAILSIYGHWIGPSGQRTNKLLAFRQVLGKHAGENQAQIVVEVLEELHIQDRIGCLVGDNAASNDTAVSAILTILHPEYTKQQRSAFGVRCLGHIFNLCAHALIFGKGKGRRCEELARTERKGDEDGWTSVWRRIGAIGRLHNIIRYIRWSPQRREEFAYCIQGGNLAEFDQLELISTLR